MMIGDIYVTPKDLPYYVNPYDHGGNMDFKDISPGNTLFLKAELAGGLLVLGDCHAVQGDGEMLGLAAECAAEVKLRIAKDEKYRPKRPFIMKPESFVCIACRNPYANAREVAIKDATEMLARIKGCTEAEAWLYVVTVGDLRNGAVWAMGKTEPEWMTKLPLVVGVEVPLLD
jgi:amidase